MLLAAFDPPGFVDDLTAPQKKKWSNYISKRIDKEMADATGHHFYNPTKKDTAADVQTAEISWTAFPRIVAAQSPSDKARWQTADGSRDAQDEYCEWSVTRDPASNKITRVTFTCEAPEYWEFLAKQNPTKVVSLYKELISPQVKKQDLFPNGAYKKRNKWNNSTTRGAMHLIQEANSLEAEINIAVSSTIIRKINGTVLTGEQELIACGGYGHEERNSDPHIGAAVNQLARQKADVCIANPVALYIRDLATVGWQTPDRSDPKQYWKILRGNANHAVRTVYEVPAAKGFVVGDITINGQPIAFGAQIADFILIKVIGQACRFGQSTAQPVTTCVGAPGVAMAAVGNVPADSTRRRMASARHFRRGRSADLRRS
jgi:hypothetical protein